MQTIIRDNRKIIYHQYTQKFKDELISVGPDEFDDVSFIVIPGMADTEFEWNFITRELRIIYSNYNNFYELVTPENFRQPEIINVGDYIIKEEDIYHIETEKNFKMKNNNMTEREMFEMSFQRPSNFFELTANRQWEIDAELGILDWEGGNLSKEDLERFHKHYKENK